MIPRQKFCEVCQGRGSNAWNGCPNCGRQDGIRQMYEQMCKSLEDEDSGVYYKTSTTMSDGVGVCRHPNLRAITVIDHKVVYDQITTSTIEDFIGEIEK